MIIFDMIDILVESKLLAPKQYILLLVILNLLILMIVFSITRLRYRETSDFNRATDFDRYYKSLMRRSKCLTCFAVISLIPALRIVLEFFTTPVAFLPQCAFIFISSLFVNLKIYKLLSLKTV